MCWCDPQKRTPICDTCPPDKKAEWPQYQHVLRDEFLDYLLAKAEQVGADTNIEGFVNPKLALACRIELKERRTEADIIAEFVKAVSDHTRGQPYWNLDYQTAMRIVAERYKVNYDHKNASSIRIGNADE
jgi:hypothetical protein